MTRQAVTNLLAGLQIQWWFAGGHAVDAFLGYHSRRHADIDVACLRRDQLAVQAHLEGWELWCADPPGRLRPWQQGEVLPSGVHDVWCRPSVNEPWRLQLMLDEAEGDDWIYRRDPRIRRPLDELLAWYEGVSFLAIEVQLLYKAPPPEVEKNEADFRACLPRLDTNQRAWLASALAVAKPESSWLARIEAAADKDSSVGDR